MRTNIHEFVETNDCCQGSLRALATMLPADDAELDALIGETVAASDQRGFTLIVLSALGANRVFETRRRA